MMKHLKRPLALMLVSLLVLAACNATGGEESASIPTATLEPLVTLTPRPTATPVVTRTPLPTFTPIPTDTLTPSETPIPPSPTATPAINGIVSGQQRINFRDGPGRTFEVIGGITPGTGLLVLGQNGDGTWLNVRLDDGTEGWVSTGLIRIASTSTPVPTATPTVDRTALALGTPLPTALIGGGTVTPTPPRAAVSATPVGTRPGDDEVLFSGDDEPTEPFLPIINVTAINETATALAGGIVEISPPPPRTQSPLTPAATGQSPNVNPTAEPEISPTVPSPPAPEGDAVVQENREIFAMCDNPALGGGSAPTDLKVGSSVIVWWSWIVADPSYIPQHEQNVVYEVALNGEVLSDWRNFGSSVRETGSSYVKSWAVPAGTLDEPGTYRVTYRATWRQTIEDGYERFGPGTPNPVEEGSCTFTVRE